MHDASSIPFGALPSPTPCPHSRDGSLDVVLAYENDAIVHKFLERFDMPFEEARALFDDVKKWMWLSGRPGRPQAMTVTEDILILDEMWHTFILFTRDYHEFCRDRVGHFVHHAPTTRSEKDRILREYEADPEGAFARSERRLEEVLVFVAEHLGAGAVHRWFVELPQRYGPEFFARAQRPTAVRDRPELLAALADVDRDYRAGAH
ncbi:glycine-rich domain-containing protein [Paraliomyxa miuraensis]|uniref:hypothetical protein n=1 Tax=Paraliomyxa miuraensis TaxID=376150 RepID=UPI00224EACBC|nr:hypothetical protein [Paraliomyxa miuraensis]MCX4248098.1 hypothetical protein [Paraliomyxa miuraensis]